MAVVSLCREVNELNPYLLLSYAIYNGRMTAGPYDPNALGFKCATLFCTKSSSNLKSSIRIGLCNLRT